MKSNKSEITALDIFAGCGGSSWGARQAGVKLKAAIDYWSLARDSYIDNFNGVEFYDQRIEEIDPFTVAERIGRIDLILASPECTSHTCAKGNNPRSEDSRMTAYQVLRFVRALKPRWVVIENVVHMRKWSKYTSLIDIFKSELGYKVTEQVLDASKFGVPQSRRRLFITCDSEIEPPKIEPESGMQTTAFSIIDRAEQYSYSPLITEKRASATLARADRAFTKIGRDKPFLIVYYGSDAAGGWQDLERPLRTVTTLDRFAYVIPNGSGHLMRMLQVPEIKAAMGFPPQFRLNYGTRRNKIHMLGNAVCPPVMERIVRTLTTTDRK